MVALLLAVCLLVSVLVAPGHGFDGRGLLALAVAFVTVTVADWKAVRRG